MDTVLAKDFWKRNCAYLLDILDNQGFMASDLGEEDEDTIAFIRSMLGEATSEEVEPTPTAIDALQVIANLPTGKNEDEMNGQESAYRAVEALFPSPPHIEAKNDL